MIDICKRIFANVNAHISFVNRGGRPLLRILARLDIHAAVSDLTVALLNVGPDYQVYWAQLLLN
jgi:hypothetical protein